MGRRADRRTCWQTAAIDRHADSLYRWMDGQTDSYFLACSIRLKDVIGSGEFGTVHRGVWSHFETDTNKMVKEEVAVKTLDHQVSQKDKVKFLQEATIMAQFKHYNIVRIRGVLTQPLVGSHILLIEMYLLNRVLFPCS